MILKQDFFGEKATFPVIRLSLLVHDGTCISHWLISRLLAITVYRQENSISQKPRRFPPLLLHFHTEQDTQMSGLLRW